MPRLCIRKLFYLLKAEFDRLNLKICGDAFFEYLRSKSLFMNCRKNYQRPSTLKDWLRKHFILMKNVMPECLKQYFVSDITYVKIRERTYYLSLVTDSKIVWHHLSDVMSAENLVKARKIADKSIVTSKELIHHSDIDLHYCSSVY